ncbi:MAG: hypothetical protein R2780_03100 [Crocinitomicaceae bacterium]|nr:hypothetical protein [Crocinitomicaceae bacterium]
MKSLIFFILFSSISIAQQYNFSNQWTMLGPDVKPLQDGHQAAAGIGPMEFMLACEEQKDLYLAGALNGGLFFTKDGGELWLPAGSDSWDYTTCAWADFHPKDPKAWFAYSCLEGDHSNPGRIGNKGAIYRTKDEGISWERIANLSSFASEWTIIHGFQFHPAKEDQLFVYTTDGLFKTNDCMAEKVVWQKVNGAEGNIYDIEFVNNDLYYSQQKDGKWNVFEMDASDLLDPKPITFISSFDDPIQTINIEPKGNSLLLLLNYQKKGDELWWYDPSTKQAEMYLKNLQVVFGNGRSFKVSPHDENFVMIGFGINIKGYNLVEKKTLDINGSGYHVDIEGVCFDPFDPKKIHLVTHGGIYTSSDLGAKWRDNSNGLAVAEVEGIAVSNADPEIIAIGCYHDGSSLRSDWQNDGVNTWKCINGGDGLIPLLPGDTSGYVYTSNQYTGGGVYLSTDWGKTHKNLHNLNRVQTSGWMMSAVLHPENNKMLMFNYSHGGRNGNVDVGRTLYPESKDSMQRITNFGLTHSLENYAVYGIYNSPYYPDHLYVHVIHMTTDEKGSPINVHRVFKTVDCTASAETVINSWFELEIPRNDWIANITPDPHKSNRIYIAYIGGIWGTEFTDLSPGMIYELKYSKSNGLKKENDISNNLKYTSTGRYNLIPDGNGGMFFGTRTGIYYGTKKTLKGKGEWEQIGFNAPHCKVHGMYFDKKTNTLTVGYFGRGVWRFYL